MAGEIEAEKKKQESQAKREMYLSPLLSPLPPTHFTAQLTPSQPASFLRALLPSQHGPRPTLLGPRRHQLPLAHGARQARAR
jgi:hypothetical protein